MTRHRGAALFGAFVALVLGIGGASPVQAKKIATADWPVAAHRMSVEAPANDPASAVISAGDKTTLTSFARVDRTDESRPNLGSPKGISTADPRSAFPLEFVSRIVEDAVRTRTASVGPAPGRSPPVAAKTR